MYCHMTKYFQALFSPLLKQCSLLRRSLSHSFIRRLCLTIKIFLSLRLFCIVIACDIRFSRDCIRRNQIVVALGALMGKCLHLCGKIKIPMKRLVIPGIVCDAVNFASQAKSDRLNANLGHSSNKHIMTNSQTKSKQKPFRVNTFRLKFKLALVLGYLSF